MAHKEADQPGRSESALNSWSQYPQSERIKGVYFDRLTPPNVAISAVLRVWGEACRLFPNPLAQIRVVCPLGQENELQQGMQEAAYSLGRGESVRAEIVGRIPFMASEIPVAIYYLQIESRGRPSFPTTLSHPEAVAHGLARRRDGRHYVRDGFSIRALEFGDGQGVDVFEQAQVDEDAAALAEEIAVLHRLAFEMPHDPSQQDPQAVYTILRHNPVLIARDREGNLASVGLLERDPRFSYGGVALVEPTYFTHPGEAYRRHGLSSQLRMAALAMTRPEVSCRTYQRAPLLIFNESVRDSSFPLSLATGYDLAGTPDLAISGNLGDAYVNIGPANRDTGYMPMGVTYYADPRIAYANQY